MRVKEDERRDEEEKSLEGEAKARPDLLADGAAFIASATASRRRVALEDALVLVRAADKVREGLLERRVRNVLDDQGGNRRVGGLVRLENINERDRQVVRHACTRAKREHVSEKSPQRAHRMCTHP